MLSVKNNDRFICAYAEANNVSWKAAKRQTNRLRHSKKELGINIKDIKKKGIAGFKLLQTDIDYKSIAHAMNFSDGIIIVKWSKRKGHAVYWNGWKVVDNVVNGKISHINNESSVSNVCFIGMLKRKKYSSLLKIRNKAMCLILKIIS